MDATSTISLAEARAARHAARDRTDRRAPGDEITALRQMGARRASGGADRPAADRPASVLRLPAPVGVPEWTGAPVPRVKQLGQLHAASRAMQDVFAVIERLAPTNVTLTLTGETGTGKDVVAHEIHALGPRAAEPFVVFDCSAIPANLAESELFGHERGSFTGAHARHTGAFERARGGTLFLDEVGELPLDLQPKLLRALESRCVRRVGGVEERPVACRVVAATNRDLGVLVSTKHFRADLYFRLAAAVVRLPPLRERLEDLPFLLTRLLADLGRPEVRVAAATMELLRSHAWPGNVRELKNALSYALAFLDGGDLTAEHLRLPAGGEDELLERLPIGGKKLEALERAALGQTLALTRGNKTQAASLLGIAVSTLYEKIKKHGL